MKLWDKLKSRKLWVAVAGMVSGAVADKPILSAILGGLYIIVEGIVDALHHENAARPNP